MEKNLSTFSGHISRICKILKIASQESLVLVDEIGSGTDPSEGVALATCILQHLLTKAALSLVTTHYADLSLLKLQDGRFENAAMEFCLSTLQPTYRVLWGTTGKSNALTIAAAVGFDFRVIDHAQEWVEKLLPDKQRERQGLLFQSLSREKEVLEADARKAESLLNQVKGLYHEVCTFSLSLSLSLSHTHTHTHSSHSSSYLCLLSRLSTLSVHSPFLSSLIHALSEWIFSLNGSIFFPSSLSISILIFLYLFICPYVYLSLLLSYPTSPSSLSIYLYLCSSVDFSQSYPAVSDSISPNLFSLFLALFLTPFLSTSYFISLSSLSMYLFLYFSLYFLYLSLRIYFFSPSPFSPFLTLPPFS